MRPLDSYWFQAALQRGVVDEAAEIVMDWVDRGIACQRVEGPCGLAHGNQILQMPTATIIPFIEAFAQCANDETERRLLLRWLGEMNAVGTPEHRQFLESAKTEVIRKACTTVYQNRRAKAGLITYRVEFENSLRKLLGELFNHGMMGGVTHITFELQILARELFFCGLRNKPRQVHIDPDNKHRLMERIAHDFPPVSDNLPNQNAHDERWLRKLVYTFYRLVQFWLLRPVSGEDFLLLCHAEGIDLWQEELKWLTHARVLKPLVPNSRPQMYHIVQVFALSAIWPDYRAQKYTAAPALADKLHAVIENVWHRLQFFSADRQHLNGSGWLMLTQEARNKHAGIGVMPSQRLWVDGLANLASAYLYAVGVRPVAAKGRPRLAPDDPMLLVLEEVVENFYREHKGFRGCLPSIRKATLYEEDKGQAINYLASHSDYFANRAGDADGLFRSWQEKFGGERVFESAIDEARAAIETLPDEELEPGAAFAFERIAAQKTVPLSDSLPQPEFLTDDVLTYVNQLTDGPADSVGCWDTRHWTWWIVPRWLMQQQVGRWLLCHVRLPLTRIDATIAFTMAD